MSSKHVEMNTYLISRRLGLGLYFRIPFFMAWGWGGGRGTVCVGWYGQVANVISAWI